MHPRVYLDNHATTPLDERVLEAMLPYLREKFGNASSRSHAFGWEAEKAVERARKQVAALIGAEPREIVFTSGATESNNLAVKGVAEAAARRGNHVITAVAEHSAVMDPCRRLARRGSEITWLPTDGEGLVDPAAVEAAIAERTVLVSVMYANNEIGVIQPVAEIGRVCRARGVPFHCDAVQAAGKVPVDVNRDQVDLMSLSAHKMYGPKGVGALYVRRRDPRVELAAQMDGGGHERGLRSGTLNVPAIVGFGEACAIAAAEMAGEGERLRALRDRLLQTLEDALDQVHVNGSRERRLPHNLNISISGVEAESLLMSLSDVALSTGSACTSATMEPSHVIRALGGPREWAHTAVRFGLGRFNTLEEIEYVGGKVVAVVKRLRELSPQYRVNAN